jgi:hypothetical protein
MELPAYRIASSISHPLRSQPSSFDMAVFSDLAPMHRRPAEYSPDMRQPRAMAICHPPTSEFSFALPSVKEVLLLVSAVNWVSLFG